MYRFFQILLVVFNVMAILLTNSLFDYSIISFLCVGSIALLELIIVKRVTLIVVFLAAFLYMIPAEGILYNSELRQQWGQDMALMGFEILIFGCLSVFTAYLLVNINRRKVIENQLSNVHIEILRPKRLLFILILYSFVFFLINVENTFYGILSGRAKAFPFWYSGLLYSIAYIVIGLFNQYFKNVKWKTLIASLPIIITFLGTGTRFFLIFIIFILFFKDLRSLQWRKSYKLILAVVAILMLTNTIKDVRRYGLSSPILLESNVDSNVNETLPEKLASYGSTESLIRNTSMISYYLKTNDNTYGSSIGFLGIFWIPRSIWPDKPTMLDNWLINKYFDVSEGYSSASSFLGEFYMDFGFGLTLIILFFLGAGLAKLDRWIEHNHFKSFRSYLISAFLMGWLFFATRSLLTSTYMLIYFLIMIKITFYALYKWNILKISHR